MLTKSIRIILFLSLSGISFNAISAIIYQADNRYIDHTRATDGPFTAATPFADFNDNWWAYEAGAFQNSTLSANGMSGSGWTYAGQDAMNYGAEGTSQFAVTFGVDQLTDFSLTGTLDTDYGGSELYVVLNENGSQIFGIDMYSLPSNGVNPFDFSGQFMVGNTYELILFSSSYDSAYYDEKWTFDLTTAPAVPVPAAIWLFASGLLGLVGMARRKTK